MSARRVQGSNAKVLDVVAARDSQEGIALSRPDYRRFDVLRVGHMKPLFIGAVGVITNSLAEGRTFYVDAMGLPLVQAKGTNFLHSENLEGSKYFGVWPLSEAAKACFGDESWPAGRPIPQMFVEFEMDSTESVAVAASELESKGYTLIHGARTDPWGQTVARLQTVDGLIVGVSYVPWMHRRARAKPKAATPSRR
jgi:catechol 2,3-dioxygenase-like lactoylglutathione lyase family enzyme